MGYERRLTDPHGGQQSINQETFQWTPTALQKLCLKKMSQAVGSGLLKTPGNDFAINQNIVGVEPDLVCALTKCKTC